MLGPPKMAPGARGARSVRMAASRGLQPDHRDEIAIEIIAHGSARASEEQGSRAPESITNYTLVIL